MLQVMVLWALAFSSPGEAPELVDVARLEPRFVLDIRYATPDNFMGRKLYQAPRCLLRRRVAMMLLKSQAYLDEHHRGHVLMLKDCYRPVSVQRYMFELVRGTPKQRYVSSPDSKIGAVHTYGAAVDLTLVDSAGREVDMGTPYDHLGVLAQPRREKKFLRQGRLTVPQVERREILRNAMVRGGGFKMVSNEWWHFDAFRGRELRKRYGRLDLPL